MRKFFVFSFLSFSGLLFSNPSAPTVAHGDAQFSSVDKQLLIQASNGSVINWQSFSIASDELTKFIQPSADSSVLSRVLGSCKSTLLGQLL